MEDKTDHKPLYIDTEVILTSAIAVSAASVLSNVTNPRLKNTKPN